MVHYLLHGFQMIAQLSDSSEVHKLHINQSMDLQTPVTVEVEESGVYQVTIFAIKDETGIVGSFVGHVQIVVGDVITLPPLLLIQQVPTSKNQHFLFLFIYFLLVVSNTTILPTPTSRRNSSDVIIISKCEYSNLIRYIMNYNTPADLGTALGIFILISIVMCGVIIVQCYMIRSQNPKIM